MNKIEKKIIDTWRQLLPEYTLRTGMNNDVKWYSRWQFMFYANDKAMYNLKLKDIEDIEEKMWYAIEEMKRYIKEEKIDKRVNRYPTKAGGSGGNNRKLSDSDVRMVLYLRQEGKTLQEIADKYQVSRERIRQITPKKERSKH